MLVLERFETEKMKPGFNRATIQRNGESKGVDLMEGGSAAVVGFWLVLFAYFVWRDSFADVARRTEEGTSNLSVLILYLFVCAGG